MLRIERTKRFRKNIKLCAKRGYDMTLLIDVTQTLIAQQPLPEHCHPHKLHGKYADYWECRIKPDWLLIYRFEPQTIIFENTGTHADLF